MILSLTQIGVGWPTVYIAAAVLIAAGLLPLISYLAGTRVGVWTCYQIARIWATVFYHWSSENPCPIPEHGPAIIVSNHTSPADPLVLWIKHFARFEKRRLRVIGYLTAKEYCQQWGPLGWICKAMQSIPVGRTGRDMAPVKAALERLNQGRLMGLFPEGRINNRAPTEKLLRPGTGVAWLALKSRAPVIPIFIRDSPRAKSMLRCFLKQSQTTLVYGQPLDLSEWLDQRPTHAVLVAVTNHIMSELAQLGGLAFTPLAAESAVEEENEDKQELPAEN
jgi:1-acyl-sn-glycerol-3-phosphate acyltransferase